MHAAWAENKAKVLPPGLLIEPVKPLDYFEVGTRARLPLLDWDGLSLTFSLDSEHVGGRDRSENRLTR